MQAARIVFERKFVRTVPILGWSKRKQLSTCKLPRVGTVLFRSLPSGSRHKTDRHLSSIGDLTRDPMKSPRVPLGGELSGCSFSRGPCKRAQYPTAPDPMVRILKKHLGSNQRFQASNGKHAIHGIGWYQVPVAWHTSDCWVDEGLFRCVSTLTRRCAWTSPDLGLGDGKRATSFQQRSAPKQFIVSPASNSRFANEARFSAIARFWSRGQVLLSARWLRQRSSWPPAIP